MNATIFSKSLMVLLGIRNYLNRDHIYPSARYIL
jgi:hypothetical protein